MIDTEANTEKAGAYVLYNGYFVFMFGFGTEHMDHELGVVRLGGHREERETVIQCVAREIKEESSLDITFYGNRYTYVEKDSGNGYEKIEGNQISNPIFVRKWKGNKLSVMYLTHGKGTLSPNMETQGILLLRKKDLEMICSKDTTFKEYKENGGKFLLANDLPENAVLLPHTQTRFLFDLLSLEKEMMTSYVESSIA